MQKRGAVGEGEGDRVRDADGVAAVPLFWAMTVWVKVELLVPMTRMNSRPQGSG